MRWFLIVSLLALPSVAHAHIELLSPVPRHTDLKDGPCGRGSVDPRSRKITAFPPGATIAVRWKETIGHPGHHRIAFDPDGARFTDPTSFTDTMPRNYVLLDDITDKTGTQEYSATVTLPNMSTTNGTLQVIQVMSDKAPYGDGNDLYYQCADITLDPTAPVEGRFVDESNLPVEAGASSTSSGASSTSSSGSTRNDAGKTPGDESSSGCTTTPTAGTLAAWPWLALYALWGPSKNRRSKRN